jgi:hypothetical protein
MNECKHSFFLKDFSENAERISKEVGNDWRVVCSHCNKSVAWSSSGKNQPTIIRWSLNRSWFGEFGLLGECR